MFCRPALLLLIASLTSTVRAVAQTPVGRRLDSAVTAAAARGFQGVVLVAERGAVVLEKGYGFANESAGTRFSPTTLVQIGSNVKDLTKVAIYQMVERGRLQVSDSLARFFPDVPADKRAITIAQLLVHRAGFPLGLGGGDRRGRTRPEFLRDLWATPLLGPPGSAERYSNAGYSLLAVIIEQLSGLPFDRYVADYILRPAGLRETGSHLAQFDQARIAHGYEGGKDIGSVLDLPHDSTGHLYQLRGNGGYVATLADQRRFFQALRDTTLLHNAASREAVFPDAGPGVYAGSDLVSFFLYASFPGDGVEILIATNHAEYKGNQLLQQLLPVLGIRPGRGDRDDATEVRAPAAPGLPDTGPGHAIAAYLEAYNSGDTTVMRRFFEAHTVQGPDAPAIATRLDRYRSMWANLGRLTVRGWRDAADGSGITVQAENASGEIVSLTFILGDGPAFPLVGIRVEVG